MNRRIGIVALILLAEQAMPGLAAAQPAPPPAGQPAALPTRDVDVAYRSEPGGPDAPAIEQRSRFSVGEQRTRLDMPTPGLFSIMDYRSRTMTIVSEPDRKVLETTGAAAAAATYQRRGEDQVAGLACTEWEAQDSVGQPALSCFTADGVLLRVRRGTLVLAVATRVTYGPQPAALFQIPAGFERLTRSVAVPPSATSRARDLEGATVKAQP